MYSLAKDERLNGKLHLPYPLQGGKTKNSTVCKYRRPDEKGKDKSYNHPINCKAGKPKVCTVCRNQCGNHVRRPAQKKIRTVYLHKTCAKIHVSMLVNVFRSINQTKNLKYTNTKN